ncbi:hypothetical protein N7463_000424 [Penicillium fimorum]|uniref:Uncharacterized protein n=1 Tax=Penicillium fimorum TaxID=1882269 RepID=A0A9X0CAX0_9EURO|nr:hypothetical protein N7463_000424 [Penicillium fimorum]
MTWDADAGCCMSIFKGHSDLVSYISWSQDDSQLASGSNDTTVRIWDLATQQGTSTPVGYDNQVRSVAWSRDGSQLVSGHDGRVMIWNPDTGRCISTLEGDKSSVSSVSWSKDESRLTSDSFHENTEVWDLVTEKRPSPLGVESPESLYFDEVNLHHRHTDVEKGVYGLNDDRTWITFEGENLLWIPSEYRTDCFSFFATCETTRMAIGRSTGHVLFLTLPNDNPISQETKRITPTTEELSNIRSMQTLPSSNGGLAVV